MIDFLNIVFKVFRKTLVGEKTHVLGHADLKLIHTQTRDRRRHINNDTNKQINNGGVGRDRGSECDDVVVVV